MSCWKERNHFGIRTSKWSAGVTSRCCGNPTSWANFKMRCSKRQSCSIKRISRMNGNYATVLSRSTIITSLGFPTHPSATISRRCSPKRLVMLSHVVSAGDSLAQLWCRLLTSSIITTSIAAMSSLVKSRVRISKVIYCRRHTLPLASKK